MALSLGTRIGPYEVTGALGVGGMGEVYRARDAQLQRDVAIKVLPTALAQDPDRLSRFEREARTLASLNHPNIAHVYGLEDAAGSKALVMELVEGPTLADRIAAGPVPLAEALPLARQIVDALEAAHEQGIVHRDLKPANVKVTPDGVIKVLDFGLAKVAEPAGGSSVAMSQSPTITTPAMTQAGVILGTAAYMSPEQAKGRPTDKRTDVWAFGCVLYEMLTGRRAFAGEDVADTLAFILTKEPDWTALPAGTPAYVRGLLRRCLEKDRKARVPDIAVARFQLDEGAAGVTGQPADTGPAARRSIGRERLVWVAALLACAVAGGWLLSRERESSTQARPVVRFTISPPEGGIFPGANGTPRMAISPDGRYLAFTANLSDGKPDQLWVRRLDSLDARQLTTITSDNGEPAQQPFWSPDSRTIGFFLEGKMRRVDLDGGVVQVVCDVPGQNFGGTWLADDTIFFSSVATGGIQRVAAAGGRPTPVTTLDASSSETAHLWPKILPDGRHFLYFARTNAESSHATYVGAIDGAARVKLLTSPLMVDFASTDVALFVRDGALMAQRLDLASFQLAGDPSLIVADVRGSMTNGRVAVSASTTGVLVYLAGLGESGADSQLWWLDRSGKELGRLGDPANIRGIELSPDERRVVMHIEDGASRGDLWVADVDRGTTSRLTFDPVAHSLSPVWASDSRRVFFRSRSKDGLPTVYEKDASGAGGERAAYTATRSGNIPVYPTAVTVDGTLILAGTNDGTTRVDLFTLPAAGGAPTPLVTSRGTDLSGQVSPDGRWLAYTSDESGRNEIFVQSFPKADTKLQVSTVGGTRPRWRADGRELFYYSNNAQSLLSVTVAPDAQTLTLGRPTVLFSVLLNAPGHEITATSYAVANNGQRFLVARPSGASTTRSDQVPLTVVLNWDAALR